jgi:hypothetical protein
VGSEGDGDVEGRLSLDEMGFLCLCTINAFAIF